MSAKLKPVTASLNVIVTNYVPPIPSALSLTTTVAVGRWVSTA